MARLDSRLSAPLLRAGGHYIAVTSHGSDCVHIDGLHCVTLDCPERECIKRDLGVRSTSNRVFSGPYSQPRNESVYLIHEIPSPRHTIRIYGYVDYLVSGDARDELASVASDILDAFGLHH